MICVDRARCLYCGGCVGICPAHAIILRETIITVDAEKCVNCGSCIKFCPAAALTGGKE